MYSHVCFKRWSILCLGNTALIYNNTQKMAVIKKKNVILNIQALYQCFALK